MEKIVCDGVSLHFWVRSARVKPASSFTIIFLHNAGADHSIWSPVVDMLSDYYNVIQFDWPGYGELRNDPKGHALVDYADILSSIIAQQRLESVVLIGNCLGSGTALEYCIRNKGQGIKAMILFNVLVPRTLSWYGRFFLNWSKSNLRYLYKKFRENLFVPWPFAGLAVKHQVKNIDCISVPTQEHLKKLYGDPRNIQNIGALIESLSESYHLDSLRMLDYFPPTMVIWGDKNKVLPLSCGKSFIQDFGPTEFYVENGGHLVMLEQPQICAENIQRFIDSHASIKLTSGG